MKLSDGESTFRILANVSHYDEDNTYTPYALLDQWLIQSGWTIAYGLPRLLRTEIFDKRKS
jgi:hypothetical protein